MEEKGGGEKCPAEKWPRITLFEGFFKGQFLLIYQYFNFYFLSFLICLVVCLETLFWCLFIVSATSIFSQFA